MAEILRCVWDFQDTQIFLVVKNTAMTLPQLKDKKQKTDLEFLVDTFEHLNDLNVILQKQRPYTRVIYSSTGFQSKTASDPKISN
jgi:hypothetical protein